MRLLSSGMMAFVFWDFLCRRFGESGCESRFVLWHSGSELDSGLTVTVMYVNLGFSQN